MPELIKDTDGILTRVSKHLANTLEATGLFTHNNKVSIVRYATDVFDGYPACSITPYNMNGFRIAVQESQRDWTLTVNIWQNIITENLPQDQVITTTQMAWDKLADVIVASAQAIDNADDINTDTGILVLGTSVMLPFAQSITGAGVKLLAKLEIQVSETIDRNF